MKRVPAKIRDRLLSVRKASKAVRKSKPKSKSKSKKSKKQKKTFRSIGTSPIDFALLNDIIGEEEQPEQEEQPEPEERKETRRMIRPTPLDLSPGLAAGAAAAAAGGAAARSHSRWDKVRDSLSNILNMRSRQEKPKSPQQVDLDLDALLNE